MKSSKKYKVIVDTNVFISGILFGGNAEKILNLIKDLKIVLLVSPEIEAEYLQKFQKFEIDRTEFEDLFYVLEFKTERFLPTKKVHICRDKKDNKFLELAEEAKADFIVTGDKDLLSLKKHRSTLIISPRLFLESLLF